MKDGEYGFYSQAAQDAGCGTTFYQLEDGSEVEVTMISTDPECSNYYWEDVVHLGRVFKFIRVGQASKYKAFK